MENKYKGLSNIGATCYMNSLLQTLFMTPEFRYGIYKWSYNQKIHPKQTDSIIFQLQKLFAKLQTAFPDQLTTKQLVKSFQWQDQEAQMQQDIQQFNRLLFQALQKSLTTKSQKYIHQNFLKDYFEGQLIHYTKCHECLNQSARQQDFQDVIITVKNVYEKVYNNRLELGLQRYLKPQILDQNNLYDCENCGKKTKAQRGARFIKMPSLLNIIFQRFTFNYFTMEREKVNDRVQFPFILNFNDYIEGYEKIPNKLDEESSEYFKSSIHSNGMNGKSKVVRQGVKSQKSTFLKKNVVSVAGKTKTKPSANTKSFLAQMRKKKKLNEQLNEDLFFVNGTGVASEQKNGNGMVEGNKQQLRRQKVESQREGKISENGIKKMNGQENGGVKDKNEMVNENQVILNCLDKNNQSKAQNTGTDSLTPSLPVMGIVPPPPLQLIPGSLSQPYKMVESGNNDSIESQLERRLLQAQKLQREKQQQLIRAQQKNKQLIKNYLKQGPLVYELYAVLVHNGTANQGHYYSYIKSFQDNHWYCFNDERVTLINVLEIQKTFGNANSNAYALYYRLVDPNYSLEQNIHSVSTVQQTQKNTSIQNNTSTYNNTSNYKNTTFDKLKVDIPSYIKERLQNEKKQIKQKEQLKINNLQNIVVLKICYQLYVKQIQLYKSNSLNLATQKARELFNIPQEVKRQNVRLRMFNPATQTKLQTFGGRQHLSLQELKISSYKSLLLQVKGENEQFEEYEVGSVSLRICLIEQKNSLQSLDESNLRLHKVSIKRDGTFEQILKQIREKRSQVLNTKAQQSDQSLCVIKRHQNNDETIHQVISTHQNINKTIQDLNILQNQILFIQPQQSTLLWPQQFQNQIYRITIKYNHPGTNQFTTYLTDSRIQLHQLKQQLSTLLSTNPNQLILKLGTKSGRELKDLNLTLKDARFITGTQLYLDYGIPAKPTEIRIQLFLATHAPNTVFNRLHQFQYLTDVPISGTLKASQVKQIFIPVIKKYKGIELTQDQFRIRERVSQKLGKIYRQKPMKEQQLIQKRQIAIQLIPDQNLDIKDFSIYFRIWDQQKWQLSQKIQLIVNKNTTIKQLSQQILLNPVNSILKESQQMYFCRILSIHKFNIIDLTQMEWFNMNQDVSVLGQPMFVNSDGLLYVVKNGNQEPLPLSKEQELKFGGSIKPMIVKNRPKSYHPKQGKSMKIKVIQKQIEPEEIQLIQNGGKNNDDSNNNSGQDKNRMQVQKGENSGMEIQRE